MSGGVRPVALITGGTRGIGLAIAKRLREGGYDIAVNGTRPESEVAERLAAELEGGSGDVVYCPGSVGSAEDRGGKLERLPCPLEERRTVHSREEGRGGVKEVETYGSEDR